MRLGQTSVIYLISKILASAIGFFATIYFTRTLGEEVYGFYAITLALVSWLGLIKSVGFGKAIVKRMSENEEQYRYLTAGTAIKGMLTLIVITGVLLFSDNVNSYVGRPVAELVVLLLIVSVFSGLVNSALKGTHRVHIYAPLSTGKETARSIVMIALVALGWELTGMLVGHATGTVLVSLAAITIIRPKLRVPRREHFRELVDFAKFSWLGSMRKKSFQNADILVLGLFVPAGLTGIYSVAYTLAKFLDIFGSAIKESLFPEMSKRSAQDDGEMIATLTNDALTFAGLFLIPGVVGAAILGDRLMLVYGSGFDLGHWILVILLVGLIIYTYTKQLLNTLNAIDRPDLAFRANGAFIFTNILFNLVLVWQIGWFGAAIATAISAAVGFLLSWRYLQDFIDIEFPVREVVRQCAAATVMGAVIFPARSLAETHLAWVDDFNAVFAVLLVGFGAAIYFTILLAISDRFRHTVNQNVPYDLPLIQ